MKAVHTFAILLTFVVNGWAYQTNTAVMENIARGEAIVSQIESLLSQSAVPQTRKASFRMVYSQSSSNSPETIGCSPLTTENCCKVIVPPATEARTRYFWDRYCTSGSDNCLSPRRCLRPRNKRTVQGCLRPQTYYVQVPRPCPSDLKSCCVGEIWFRTGCISISELERWLEYLQNGGSGYPPCMVSTTTPRPRATWHLYRYRRPYRLGRLRRYRH